MSTTIPDFLNLVDGDWRASASGDVVEVRNPAVADEIVATVPAMTAADLDEVYASAAAGARVWAATSPIARGRVLLRAAQLLRERQAGIARDLTLEMGKTLAESTGEVGKSADFLEYCGGLGRAVQGELLADERPGVRVWTIHEPVGVVLAICPWNDPLLTPARKVAPALIAGNAVVLKPATYTPLVSIHLARALADAGLPAGVLTTVTGSARTIGDALVTHPALRAVSFTGSNEVGEQLKRTLVDRNVKLLAELGGKNAAVVLADADLDLAARTIAAAGFAQAGQRCTATSRVLVAHEVADAFLERLAGLAGDLILGAGLDARTTMGPVVAPEQKESVRGFIDRAISAGAALAHGAGPLEGELADGSFVAPTVLGDVATDMEVWREEVFGPVIAVAPFATVDQALDEVNQSRYGLASAVFTRDLSAAMHFVDAADSGHVSVNLPTSGWDVHMPFGGFKDSGSGAKEQGLEGVAFYTRTKTVALGT